MEINQAFKILQNAGGIRAARIITDNWKHLNYFNVWCMARALRRGVPVAKIIHKKWFWGMQFYTNKHTLDPRPDTETLVSAVISDCTTNVPRKILDLGTGTGCIIAALVASIPNAWGMAIEKSWWARRVARKNIRNLNLGGRVQIKRGNFHNSRSVPQNMFDIIVSNPPYIAYNDNRVDTGALHDPKMALFADRNGLGAYISIAKNARNWIKRGGAIYLEIGIDQETDVRNIFEHNGWEYIRTEYDLAHIPRVLVFKQN